ncbi:DUF4349 domain-containing protein [Candidatus Dojkabacteria bacterium]|nr:DUF4349 domain-containing protein [Candidatus Dojkabacteria bacterium]
MKEKKSLSKVFVILSVFLGVLLFLSIGVIFIGNFAFKRTRTIVEPGGGNLSFYSRRGDSTLALSPSITTMYEGSYAEYEEAENVEYEERDAKLVKTGEISVEVDDIDETVESISNIIEIYDASIMSLNDTGKGLYRNVFLSIRIEQANFESLFDEIKGLEGEFSESSISVSDVTETYIDLKARLNNHKNVEEQFLKILEKAETVEETLSVYNEVSKVRLEIERIELQLKNLETQTDYSYIYIRIHQSSEGAELEEKGWRPVGVLKDALRALVSFGQFLGSILIWLVVFSPVIALFVVPAVIIQKKRKK